MSEQKLVSPLLDGFVMGAPMSEHDGIRCCPAMKENSDEKYIVKIISVPASQVQLDALLLTGAYKDPAEATDYFREVAENIAAEVEVLNTLSRLEGFLTYEGCQIVPMEDGKLGYEIYLLSSYRRTLRRYMRKNPVTHLEAVNLGLDLCASLAICRKAGYLYVALKPSNIFLSREKQYRIGDLGFVKLDSLSYTSLPGKYRSAYSPLEVQDDLKVLNDTVDTYAVGMILYQIYNEGTLPNPPLEPTDPFPHPANADYEISAIIMKALDPDPSKRWKDPMEMGQALVGYMQRNPVNNIPITPPSGILPEVQPEGAEAVPCADAAEEPLPEDAAAPEAAAAAPECAAEKTSAESEPEALPSEPVSQPEAPAEEEEDLDFSIAFSDTPEAPRAEPVRPAPAEKKPMPVRKPRKKRGKTVLVLLILLVLLGGIAAGGFWFYQTQYLQTIDSLSLSGTQNELTVTVEAGMDTSHIQVTCTDTYGNSIVQPLVDNRAVFTDLLPDSLYRIELSAEGFHALTGETADIFTTDALSTIVSLSAVAGAEDGSVMVNFTVDGAEPDEWVVTCSAHGEEDIVTPFTGHSVTVKGLVVGKVYTITLGCANGDQVLGESSVEFTATRLVMAQNLSIADCAGGIMTVRWDAPADAPVESWKVRCYNDEGHEEVLEISGTEISFTGIDNSKAYTIEVTAAGMTQASRISISADPITVTGISVSSDQEGQLTVSWGFEGAEPEGGWLLLYTLDKDPLQNVVKCEAASAVISPVIPSAEYHFELQAADSGTVFNSKHSYVVPAADVFNEQGLSADKITAHLLKTPEAESWTIESVGEDALTDTFRVGESISVVLSAADKFYLPEMDIDVMYVIRDGSGSVLSQYVSHETVDWKELWYDDNYQYGELTIPTVPDAPGDYSVSIYFNNRAVTATTFTILE